MFCGGDGHPEVHGRSARKAVTSPAEDEGPGVELGDDRGGTALEGFRVDEETL